MEFEEYIVPALYPVSVVVWGEMAMGFLGVRTLLNVSISLPSLDTRSKIQIQELHASAC